VALGAGGVPMTTVDPAAGVSNAKWRPVGLGVMGLAYALYRKGIPFASKEAVEFNDEFTRARFVNMVEPYLREVKARRGIYDFRVVCDNTNNTPAIIDANEFVADIYIQPARSINFIILNFIATPTGVNFQEIIEGTKSGISV